MGDYILNWFSSITAGASAPGYASTGQDGQYLK